MSAKKGWKTLKFYSLNEEEFRILQLLWHKSFSLSTQQIYESFVLDLIEEKIPMPPHKTIEDEKTKTIRREFETENLKEKGINPDFVEIHKLIQGYILPSYPKKLIQLAKKHLAIPSYDKIRRILEDLSKKGIIEKREIPEEEKKKERYLWYIPQDIRDSQSLRGLMAGHMLIEQKPTKDVANLEQIEKRMDKLLAELDKLSPEERTRYSMLFQQINNQHDYQIELPEKKFMKK